MKNIYAIISLFSFALSYSQITFEKGYFIDNAGTRTDCFIKNTDSKNSPVSFKYKIEKDSDSQIQDLANIQEFGIDGAAKYQRFDVRIERSMIDNILNLSQNRSPVWREETLFLKVLVSGEANLYSYTGQGIEKFFFDTKSTPVEQLVYIQYLSSDNGNTAEAVRENNMFRQQLNNNVKCTNTPPEDFYAIKYNQRDLVKHFLKYNSCSTAAVINYAEKPNGQNALLLKITSGIYLASLSITDPATAYNVSTDLQKTIFKFGIEGEYLLPFNKNSWGVFLNPSYQKFETDKSYVKIKSGANDETANYTASIDYSSIELPLGLRHYFFIGKSSKIFVNMAYVFDLEFHSKLDFTIAGVFYRNDSSVSIYTRSNVAVGTGFSYKRFCGEIRFNTGREIFEDKYWKGKYSSFGIVLGYRIL